MKYINYTFLCFYLFLNGAVTFAGTSNSQTQNIEPLFNNVFISRAFARSTELTSIYCNVLYLNKMLIVWNERTVIAGLDDYHTSKIYLSHTSSNPSHLFSILGVRLQRKIGSTVSDSDQILIYLVNDQSRGTLIMGNYYYELYGCTPAFADYNNQ